MSRLTCCFLLVGLQACAATSRSPGMDPTPPAIEDDSLAAADQNGDLVEDDVESSPEPGQTEPPPKPAQPPHPFADLSDEQLEKMLLEDPASLGPVSIGQTNAGSLLGGEKMPGGDRWYLVDPEQSYGTRETIEALVRCIDKVNDQFENTEKLKIGDISRKNGGYFVPHISHQSGRDVDLSYYYTTPQNWYMAGDASNLDLHRTWALVRAMVTETDVELIIIDRSIQKLLKAHALEIGEDPAWLDTIFGGESTTLRPLIRHAKGHKTHIHVRFYNPIAQETGRRLYPKLIAHKMIKPPTYHIKYKVKRGDTLSRIAKRYKTTVKALKRANRLRSSRIYAGRTYRIPRRGGVRKTMGALVIPSRRLPPTEPSLVPRVSEATEGAAEKAGGAAEENKDPPAPVVDRAP